jgi:hypothetical protein
VAEPPGWRGRVDDVDAIGSGVLATETSAPTPPGMPRVLFSKSAISSKIAVQLKMR